MSAPVVKLKPGWLEREMNAASLELRLRKLTALVCVAMRRGQPDRAHAILRRMAGVIDREPRG